MEDLEKTELQPEILRGEMDAAPKVSGVKFTQIGYGGEGNRVYERGLDANATATR